MSSMWRSCVASIGAFIKNKLGFGTLAAIFGIAGGGYVIVVYVGEQPAKTTLQAALEILEVFAYLLGFLISVYLILQGLGWLLLKVSAYYPDWYYLPKLDSNIFVNEDNEIMLRVQKMNKPTAIIGISVQYVKKVDKSILYLGSPLHGTAPFEYRVILSFKKMKGEYVLEKKVGHVGDGSFTLQMGQGEDAGEYEIKEPGLYEYKLFYSGKYRNREFKPLKSQFYFRLRSNHQFVVEVVSGGA